MEQEIIDGNKLIANSPFAGEAVRHEIEHHTESGNSVGLEHFYSKLEYHKDWNKLMPVVEKIAGLSYNESNNRFAPSVETFLENDIMAIWRKVVSFIKWYNETKSLS